jgi:phosphoglycerate dehydrogenase-like enzyme
MRIVFRGQAFEADVAEFAARRGLDFFAARDEAELLDALPAADALWITPTCYTSAVASAVCANPGRLKWLGLTSAGYDVLLRNGAPPGVTLTYATSVHGPAVAEHAVSLLLALVRRLPVSFAAQGRHAWDPSVIAGLRSPNACGRSVSASSVSHAPVQPMHAPTRCSQRNSCLRRSRSATRRFSR